MPKKIQMFGRKSLERAQDYVAQYPDRDLVILKNNLSWRIAVCNPTTAEKLKSQGFAPVKAKK
jgi:hypothetical protein